MKKLFRFLKKAPYYQSFLQHKNSLDDFPVMDKTTFMQDFDQINTCGILLKDALHCAIESEKSRDFSPMISGITIGLSSGTSGNRGVFLASEKERAQWVAYMLDRVIGFSLKKRSVAFFLRANSNLYASAKSSLLAFHYFDLLHPVKEHIERLNQLQPTILVAQPSLLIELANAMEEKRLHIHPGKVISVAEVLTPEDKAYLSLVFKQTIHQVYQCTEGFLASTCQHGTLHFNDDFLVIEKKFLDKEKKRFHPIITDLKRRSQVIVRYELNDIIVGKNSCPCNSPMQAIESIEGRADDVLVFLNTQSEEVKIFPDFFRRAIILSDEQISDYALIQKSPESLSLYIRSQCQNSFEKASEAIQQLLNSYSVVDVKISRLDDNQHQRGDKLRRIKNDSRKTN